MCVIQVSYSSYQLVCSRGCAKDARKPLIGICNAPFFLEVGLESLRLALTGASDPETKAIEKQLSILKPYLDRPWCIDHAISDGGADLELIYREGTNGQRAKVRKVLEKNRTFDDPDLAFELPVRLFNLLDMLTFGQEKLSELEKQSRLAVQKPHDGHETKVHESAIGEDVQWRSAAKWLSLISLEESTYQCGDVYIVSCPAEKLFKTNALDKAQLVRFLTENPLDAWNKSDALSILNASMDFSASSLIWSVALCEKEYALQNWADPEFLYRLKRWPQLGLWQSTAEMFKLSSLFGRKSASIKTGMKVSGALEKDVALFLHACDAAGLDVEISTQEVDTAINPPIDASLAVLQAFKTKLGI
jgi:hypothetical protein